MSKFDMQHARSMVADGAFAPRTLERALDHIDALEVRIAKLEAVREAAKAARIYCMGTDCTTQRVKQRLDDALAACDDGVGA